MMQTLQFYKTTTWVLLLFNLAMIAFFFFMPPPPPNGGPENEMSKRAIDVFGFDKEQNDSFLALAQQHQQQMRTFNTQQYGLVETYFNHLLDENNTPTKESLLADIQALEAKKIESTYQHYQDVKSILKPEQEVHFAGFVQRTLKKILPNPKKR